MLSPPPANPILLNSFLLPTLLVHFAWLGLMAGGATAAVALDILGTRERHRVLAAAILSRIGPGATEAALLGLTTTLILLCAQLGYPIPAPSALFWGGALAPLLAGLAFLALYRRLLRHERGFPFRSGCGLAGIALVLASSFLLCCGSGLLVMPEKWPLLKSMPLLLLSWSGTGRYLEFTALSLAAAGAAILLVGRESAAPDNALAARRLGGGMALVFLLAWPPALLFTLFNLPAIALSWGIWLLAALGVAAAAVGVGVAAGLLGEHEGFRTWLLFAVTLALFVIWIALDGLARENAIDAASLGGVAAVPARAPVARRPAAAPPAAAGEAVFQRICSTCHRFDAKVVGPPLNSVVPKYRKDPEALKAFIRSPVKRDPAYPQMPKLPLTEAEVEAVADYLLKKAAP